MKSSQCQLAGTVVGLLFMKAGVQQPLNASSDHQSHQMSAQHTGLLGAPVHAVFW